MATLKTVDGIIHFTKESREDIDNMLEGDSCIVSGKVTLDCLLVDTGKVETNSFIIQNIIKYS